MIRDWDQHFLRKALLNAQMTTCQVRSVGAVAVRGNRTLAEGFNGNLPGQPHCIDGGCRRCADESRAAGLDLGECTCIHAEENIVTFAASTGLSLRGATVYSTHRPCWICTRLLAACQVQELVYAKDYPVPEWVALLPIGARAVVLHV